MMGYQTVKKKFQDRFIQLDTIPAYDRQTDRQTDRHLSTAKTALTHSVALAKILLGAQGY